MINYEYKLISKTEAFEGCGGFEKKELNKLGKDGWFMCGVAFRDSSGTIGTWIYYFMRMVNDGN